jgi:hypothetical protein
MYWQYFINQFSGRINFDGQNLNKINWERVVFFILELLSISCNIKVLMDTFDAGTLDLLLNWVMTSSVPKRGGNVSDFYFH